MRAALVALVLLRAQSVSAATYSLDALLARVRQYHPGVEAARAGVATARALVGQAQLQWAPYGDFFFKLVPTPTVRNAHDSLDPNNIPDSGLSTTYVDWMHPRSADGLRAAEPFQGALFTLSLSFVQPLYTFGKISSATGAAKGGVMLARGYEEIALADAELEAIRSYWGVKCYRSARGIMDDIVARLDAQVTEFQREMDGANQAGYTEGDLARLKAALENARVTRFDLERQEINAREALRALARDPQGDADDGPPVIEQGSSRSVDSWIDAGEVHRPEVRLLEGGRQALEFLRKWRFADMLPSLAFLSGFGYGQASSIENPLISSVVGTPSTYYPYFSFGPMALHWDLDLAVRHARLWQARAAERAIRETERWARGGIRVEVKKAWADHDEAFRRALELAHAEKVARGWFQTVQDNMASGITVAADSRELVDSMRVYFDFRLRHMQAILDANLTLAQLHRVAGVR